ncbi:MAG: RidA family protein [Pseudomonadota bacterium]
MRLKPCLAAAALMATTSPALAQEEAATEETNAPRIVPDVWQEAYDVFHYAPAVRAGDTLYLSGIVASLQGDENENDPAALEAAFDRAFEAIGGVLAEAGADWSDVVEMTTFHTELIHQVGPFTTSKDKFVKAPYPAWTAIDVDRLYPERGIVEIKVIAYVPE